MSIAFLLLLHVLNTFYSSHLYGNNRDQQLSVRQMKGGLLKPDQWYDKRLVLQPAGKKFMTFSPEKMN